MVAFTQPPRKSSQPAELGHACHVLADMLPTTTESDPSGILPPMVGWKAWLLVGWMTAAVLWGIRHTIGILL